MKILLVTPPLLQMNTPYPAVPVLAGFLQSRGQAVSQADLSLELALRLFSRPGLTRVFAACRKVPHPSPNLRALLRRRQAYLDTIEPVIRFLQGRSVPRGFIGRIARRELLPEGPRLAAEAQGQGISPDEAIRMLLASLPSLRDRAAFIASLYLDDLADAIREGVDPDFGFSRYAEHLAVALPSFAPVLKRLRAEPTMIDREIDSLAEELLLRERPGILGLTIPFPGTLLGAFRIAAVCRRLLPDCKIVLGGGYVNTELRELSDGRVFEYADAILYDEGFAPWLGILGQGPQVRTLTRANFRDPSAAIASVASRSAAAPKPCPQTCINPGLPDYADVDFSRYFDLLETVNPMHRLWSDGKWVKVQLANGCYWHRCAFCDVSLDYIGSYRPPAIARTADELEALAAATGQTGFHFTDEALAPGLLRQLSAELLRRGDRFRWWGNIRFEAGFTPELAGQLAAAGCIAVTGGLECANDRLLKLMNKGITLAGAAAACGSLAAAGILVHAYLMYGFPTETKAETLGALDYVRERFACGEIQSAYWHRFALTVHSPIAAHPEAFGIRLAEEPPRAKRFARNEIAYTEPNVPDLARLGRGLRFALYNYMLGIGFDVPVEDWFRS